MPIAAAIQSVSGQPRPARVRGAAGPAVALPAASLLFASLLVATAHAHPFHVSMAEAEWNGQRGRFEVSLKLHPLDLEQALRRQTGLPVRLEPTDRVERLLENYLRQTFVVRDAEKRRVTLRWVGSELSVKEAWLYFEIPVASPDGTRFSNGLLFEVLNDQVNTVNFRVGRERRSLVFSRDRPDRVLRLSDGERSERRPPDRRGETRTGR